MHDIYGQHEIGRFEWQQNGKRPLGQPKQRRVDRLGSDVQTLNAEELCNSREARKGVVIEANDLNGLYKATKKEE